MKTLVAVEGQTLRWYGKIPEIADNSVQFVQLEFSLPEDWADLVVVAQFSQTKTYNKLLENGCCYLPAELVAGPCEVSLFGQRTGETVRATSVPLRFKISRSGFTSTAETPIPPTPDLYAQLLEKLGHKGPSESVSIEDDGEGNVSFAPGFEGDGEDHELNSLNTGKTVYTSFPDKVAREGLKGKLANPGGLTPGKLLRVKSVDQEGNILLEGVDMPSGGSFVTIDTTLTQPGQAADAKATGDAISKLSGQNAANLSGVQTVLRNVMTIIRAQVEDASGTPQAYSVDISGLAAECDALIAAMGGETPDDPEQPAKTLVSISTAYTGGEVVVGTALTALTGIVVTAHYSDGSTAVVTGYTLSGEIVEGSNTITVSYGGKTATITVVGVASGDEEPAEPPYGRFWPPVSKVRDWNNHQWDDVENFAYTSNNAGTPTEYTNAGLPGGSFVRLDKLQGTVYIRTLTNNQYGYLESGYAVYANADGEISTGGFEKVPATIYRHFDGKAQTIEVDGVTYYFTLFKFEIPVGQTGYFVSQPNAMSNGLFISADKTGIDDEYKPYYTLFGSDPSDRITEPATEVA